MLQWFQAHWGDILVLLVLGACVAGIVLSMRRDRKKDRSCCGSCAGCSGCARSGACQTGK